MDDLQFKKNYSALIQPGYGVGNAPAQVQKKQENPQSSEFAALFRQTLSKSGSLNFSRHAIERMESRSIQLSADKVTQLSGAVEKARSKGVRDALVLDGSTAFIVNVPSSTVITLMNNREMTDNVFTNIDGAVVL